jgi:hypothetical protein
MIALQTVYMCSKLFLYSYIKFTKCWHTAGTFSESIYGKS